MANLVYSAIASLDGYVADESGDFGLLAPDEEVHAFANDLERSIETQLYGRRMYEVMVAWETMGLEENEPAVIRAFGEGWRAAEKVVYSTTLDSPRSAKTRIEQVFDPEAVRRMKASAEADIAIGGPTLAGHALKAGLVDECHFLLVPVVFGGGLRFLPDGVRLQLELVSERRFGNGVVHLHYSSS